MPLPFPTIVATLITVIASIAFAITTYYGCTRVIEQFDHTFNLHAGWLDLLRWLAALLCAFTVLLSLVTLHVCWKRVRSVHREPNSDRLCTAGVSR